MTFREFGVVSRCCAGAALACLVCTASLPATAQSNRDARGRVPFDFPGAPQATVEVDLDEQTLSAMMGIGQAAIAGAAEALLSATSDQGVVPARQSAEQLQAVNEIVSALDGSVNEVRVRIYDDSAELDSDSARSMTAHYHKKLQDSDWKQIVRVRDREDAVTVSMLSEEDSIQGVFVVVSEDDELVLVNVVCDLTPERVQQLARQAVSIAMQFGLHEMLQQAVNVNVRVVGPRPQAGTLHESKVDVRRSDPRPDLSKSSTSSRGELSEPISVVSLEDVVGTWDLSIDSVDGNLYEVPLQISKRDDGFHGAYTPSSGKTTDVTNLNVIDGHLMFDVATTYRGSPIRLAFTGRLDDERIVGIQEWVLGDDSGENSFYAKRRR